MVTAKDRSLDRRAFLDSTLSAVAVCGFGCPRLLGSIRRAPGVAQSLMEKAQQNSGMTYVEVPDFAYRGWVIPLAQELEREIGEEVFLGLLKTASTRAGKKQGAALAAQLRANDFQAFAENFKKQEGVFANTQTFEVVQESERSLQVRFTGCFCADVFRESGAAEIGYAMMCHPDAAVVEGFNPNLRMTRTRTLMEGHDCCDHRWFVADQGRRGRRGFDFSHHLAESKFDVEPGRGETLGPGQGMNGLGPRKLRSTLMETPVLVSPSELTRIIPVNLDGITKRRDSLRIDLNNCGES